MAIKRRVKEFLWIFIAMSGATWPNRSCKVWLYRSVSQHHGMTVIIGGYHASLLLIACGTNSELSCSARSGLRHLFRSPSRSFSVALPRINRWQPGIQEEGVPRPISRSQQLRLSWDTKNRGIAATSRYVKWVEIREVSENASRNATRVIELSNRLLQRSNCSLCAF